MFNDSDLNTLISNIVSENRFSNCRLCLKEIRDQYVRFGDDISLEFDDDFQPLFLVLSKLFGQEICDDIPGLDAVCVECVDQVLRAARFLFKCKNADRTLHKVIENLNNCLISVDVNSTNSKQALYVKIKDTESKAFLALKEPKTVSNIACSECEESFSCHDLLKAHHVDVHGSFKCDTCFGTFTNVDAYSMHICESEGIYKCPSCDQTRRSALSLRQHVDKIHRKYVCADCGRSFVGRDKMVIHEQKHTTKSKCPKCGKVYFTKDFFEKHVSLCLNDKIDPHPTRNDLEKPFSCDKCNKSYSTTGGLRVHNRFFHGNAKFHTCKECGKDFTAPSYLKSHMIKHTKEKNFKCNMCGNRFVTKEALLYHTRRHTGEKPYKCKICDERFVNSSARAEHVKYKHIGPTLTCEICSKKFVTKSFLKAHIKRHNDPSSKIYCGRKLIPPNMPGIGNMRCKIQVED